MTDYPADPTSLGQWGGQKWRDADRAEQQKPDREELLAWALGVDVQTARTAGRHQARDLDRITPARRRRIDYGALHCAFWSLVTIALFAVTIAAWLR